MVKKKSRKQTEKIYRLDKFLAFRVPYGLIYIGGKNTDREKVNRMPPGLYIYIMVDDETDPMPSGADQCSTIYIYI